MNTEAFPQTLIQRAYAIGRRDDYELGGLDTHIYYEFHVDFDAEELQRALDLVIARHPMLHTVAVDDRLQRELWPCPRFPLGVHDFSALSPQDATEALLALRDQRRWVTSDLRRWPQYSMDWVLLPTEERHVLLRFDLAIADGPSIMVMLGDVVAVMRGGVDALAAEPPCFADFATASERARDEANSAHAAFWSEVFPSCPAPPSLPVCEPSAVLAPAPRFARHTLKIDPHAWAALRRSARGHRVSLQMLLFTAYVEVLRRWSGDADFTVNFTLSNRPRPASAGAEPVGEYTSLLLVPVGEGEPGFWEEAHRLTRHVLRLLRHRDYDGVEVLRDLSVRFNGGRPLQLPVVFTAMLADERCLSQGVDDFGAIAFACSATSQVVLDCQVLEKPSEITVSFDFREGVLADDVVRGMLHDLGQLLDALARDDGRSPHEALALAPRDAEAWRRYNDTAVTIPARTLDGLVTDRIAVCGDAEAVRDAETSLTYCELGERADALATDLRRLGVGVGDYVAVDGARECATVVAMLAVLRTGAAFVPLDPSHPHQRRQQVLSRSGARVLIESGQATTLRDLDDDRPARPRRVADPAYAIFTSGTTGEPKGVVISHAAASNTVQDMNARFGLGPSDRVAGISSFCFDLSVYDVFGALSTGATLVIIDDARDIPALVDRVCREGITFWNTVPAIMGLFVGELEFRLGAALPYWLQAGDVRLDIPWDLRTVLLSGDWIPVGLPERVRSLMPRADVVSLGGATEASIWSIIYPVGVVDPAWSSIPYGHPMANQTFWVVDRQHRVVPVGVVGQLAIGGDGVAEGYLNAPELTDAAFVDIPQTGRVYLTGDFGVLQADGEMRFLGRRDGQVKVAGHRIELAEIENALCALPGIEDAAATVARGERGGALIGYYVSARPWETGELKEALSATLPPYMVPAQLCRLTALPLSSNGKVDKSALPAPEHAAVVEPAVPADETTQTIARIWAEALGRDTLGPTENVFAEGADSIMAIHVRARLREVGLDQFSVLQLFECPTPASLRALLGAGPSAPGTASASGRPMLATLEQYMDAWGSLGSRTSSAPRRVLVTGGTGFFGAHLVASELRAGVEGVVCVVRGASAQIATGRLRSSLVRMLGEVEADWCLARTTVVLGDVTRPGFGWAPGAAREILSGVDALVHSAADVAHFGDPARLRSTNVEAVRHAIDLARSHGLRLYHVSTSQVLGETASDGLFTELHLDVGQAFPDLYARTKFEAELACREAFAAGLDGAVFRVGNLAFAARTGALPPRPEQTTFVCMLAAIRQLGCVPELLGQAIDLSYVDVAAQGVSALIHAGRLPDSRVFHVANDHAASIADLTADGPALPTVAVGEFVDRLSRAFEHDPRNAILHNCLINAHVWGGRYGRQFTSLATTGLLANLGISWPALSDVHQPVFDSIHSIDA